MLDVTQLIGFGAYTQSQALPWEYVGQSAVASGADVTITLSSHQAGDLLIIHASGDATDYDPTPPSGWTSILNSLNNPIHFIAYKIATTGSETNPTLSGGATTYARAICYVYRNISGLDVAGSETFANDTTADATSLNTTSANDLVLNFFAVRRGTNSWTAPSGTGLTKRYELNPTANNVGLLLVDENKETVGATTARTATLPTSRNNSGIQVSFKQVV